MTKLVNLALVTWCAFSTACTVAQETEPTAVVEQGLHAAWDRIVKTRVTDGLVDYPAIAKHDKPRLDAYLERLARTDYEKLSKADLYAFGINLYNASMVAAIVEKRAADPTWLPPRDDFAVFKEKRVKILRTIISLDDLEHHVLRPRMEDHRMHVALVCGARSCPRLLSRAYEGADLEATLAQNWKRFLADSALNRIDRKRKTMQLSSLLDWFKADFGGESGIRKLIANEFGTEVAAFRIEFIEYDWKLNETPRLGTKP